MTDTTTLGEVHVAPELVGQPGELRIENLVKRYPNSKNAAVDGISLTVQAGEFLTLLGPSGCGKTTTLRMIAGFEKVTEGDILLDGQSICATEPNKRPMSMVFQSYALFPHLTVRQNVAFGLKLKKIKGQQLIDETDSALASMDLVRYADRAPHQLSGGQQQRVALARAMVMKPKVLLFDEPLSNLDAKLRGQMRIEIRRIQQQLGITSVFVTHDQEEAMTLSDRVVVMNLGRIEQIDTPEMVYHKPASLFVADFIGRANFLDARVVRTVPGGKAEIDLHGHSLTVPAHASIVAGKKSALMVRPESLVVRAHGAQGDPRSVDGTVLSRVFLGQTVEYEIETAVGTLLASVSDPQVDELARPGESVTVGIGVDRAWLLPVEA